MATPTIASLSFIGWRGRLHAGVRRIARLPPRPGVNGEAKVMDGWGTNPEPIVTSSLFATEALAEAALEGYRGLMDGATKTAVTPIGKSWSVKVDNVTGDISWTPTGTFRLVATWSLQVEAAAP